MKLNDRDVFDALTGLHFAVQQVVGICSKISDDRDQRLFLARHSANKAAEALDRMNQAITTPHEPRRRD